MLIVLIALNPALNLAIKALSPVKPGYRSSRCFNATLGANWWEDSSPTYRLVRENLRPVSPPTVWLTLYLSVV